MIHTMIKRPMTKRQIEGKIRHYSNRFHGGEVGVKDIIKEYKAKLATEHPTNIPFWVTREGIYGF